MISAASAQPAVQISQLADPQKLIEQGLAERGESADAATVERVPLILQSHPDVWALVPDPVRLKSPVARPMLRIGQLRAVRRAAYFQPIGPPPRVYSGRRGDHAFRRGQCIPENPGRTTRIRDTDSYRSFAVQSAAHNSVTLHAVSFRAASRCGS